MDTGIKLRRFFFCNFQDIMVCSICVHNVTVYPTNSHLHVQGWVLFPHSAFPRGCVSAQLAFLSKIKLHCVSKNVPTFKL